MVGWTTRTCQASPFELNLRCPPLQSTLSNSELSGTAAWCPCPPKKTLLQLTMCWPHPLRARIHPLLLMDRCQTWPCWTQGSRMIHHCRWHGEACQNVDKLPLTMLESIRKMSMMTMMLWNSSTSMNRRMTHNHIFHQMILRQGPAYLKRFCRALWSMKLDNENDMLTCDGIHNLPCSAAWLNFSTSHSILYLNFMIYKHVQKAYLTLLTPWLCTSSMTCLQDRLTNLWFWMLWSMTKALHLSLIAAQSDLHTYCHGPHYWVQLELTNTAVQSKTDVLCNSTDTIGPCKTPLTSASATEPTSVSMFHLGPEILPVRHKPFGRPKPDNLFQVLRMHFLSISGLTSSAPLSPRLTLPASLIPMETLRAATKNLMLILLTGPMPRTRILLMCRTCLILQMLISFLMMISMAASLPIGELKL